MALKSETVHVGVLAFNELSIIRSSVCVHRAQFRLAQRWAS